MKLGQSLLQEKKSARLSKLTSVITYIPAPITYNIVASAGLNGSITPNGTKLITQGDSQTYTFIPDANYKVSDVLIDDVSIGALSSYTFTNVQEPHTISVAFTQNVVISTSSLVSYYNFEGNSNDVISSINGVDTSITYTDGKIGTGASFLNGLDSGIITSAIPVTGMNITGTYNIWFKTGLTDRQVILDFGDNDTIADGLQLFIYNGKLRVDFTLKPGPSSDQTVTDNQWHMATVSLAGGTGKLYLDGVLQGIIGENDLSITTRGSNSRYIGSYQATYWPFVGTLDEFSVWSSSLTETEISNLYNAGLGVQYPFVQ